MDMRRPQSSYKWCIVPKCTSTSIRNSEKHFINLPKDQKIRTKWLKAIRRDVKSISLKSVCFVCEDHFDLENDLQNYVKWKLVGGLKTLKKHVVPHKFDCQDDRKRTVSHDPRPTTVKRVRKQLVEETEQLYDAVHKAVTEEQEKPSEEPCIIHSSNKKEHAIQTSTQNFGDKLQTDVKNYAKYTLVGGRKVLRSEVLPHRFDCQQISKDNKPEFPLLTRGVTEYYPNEFVSCGNNIETLNNPIKKSPMLNNDMENSMQWKMKNEQIKLEKEEPVHASEVAPSTSTHQLGWDETSSTESDTNSQENSSKQYQARRYDSITDKNYSDNDGEDDIDDSYFEYEKETNNTNEMALATLMKRHEGKEQLEVHPVDAFLTGLAPTLKSLTPYYLNIAKSRIFDAVQEIEMEQIVTVKSECVTPPETGPSSPIPCQFEPKIEIEETPLSNLDHNYASEI